jgi:far upstream element-binding protein
MSQIPDQDVGMCIGKSGCVIRELQMRTQTKIQIPSQPVPGQIYRIATVTGPPEGCQKVQEIIARISAEQSSQFVMTGEVFNPYGQQMYGQLGHGQYMQQQQQQQQYGGQQAVDYSAQWAAYYAAQSAVQTNGGATQSTAAASTPAPAAGQQVAADQYYEDFFRYSYYYGEEAARQQYGAWAPPEGTPNPYGVNPNLSTTAAPAGASTPSTVAATSGSSVVSSAVADVKDSSVRKGVSNLPAWMTKNE